MFESGWEGDRLYTVEMRIERKSGWLRESPYDLFSLKIPGGPGDNSEGTKYEMQNAEKKKTSEENKTISIDCWAQGLGAIRWYPVTRERLFRYAILTYNDATV